MTFSFADAGAQAANAGTTSRPAPALASKVSTSYVAAATQASTVLPADAMVDPLSSPDAEFEVCSWLLRLSSEDLDQGLRVLERLADTDVSLSLHKCIVEAARHFITRNQVCGASAVLDYAVTKGLDVGGADYLAQAVSDPICLAADLDRIHQDVEIILDYAARRRTRSMLQDRLNDLSTKPMREVVGALADDIVALQADSNVASNEPKHISEVMAEVLEDAFGESVESAPISTGFPDLDLRLNGGFRDQELILVGGRPGMGKTAFKLGMARNMSLDTSHRRNVLIFSLEMTSKSLGSRILSAESAVPAKILRSGMAGSDDAYLSALHQVLPRFAGLDGSEDCSNSRLWIDDTPGLSLQEIRSRSRAFARKFGRPVIFVDYLQIVSQTDLLAGNGAREKRSEAVGMVSQGLKALARELNTPVIALSQLNRSLEQRANKHPMISDLRESGSLEQDADIILFLYRDVIYNPDTPDPDEALVLVGKQREGELGPVPLTFNSAVVRFEHRGFSSRGADY